MATTTTPGGNKNLLLHAGAGGGANNGGSSCTTPGGGLVAAAAFSNNKTPGGGKMDRFIPARSAMDLDLANMQLLNGGGMSVDTTHHHHPHTTATSPSAHTAAAAAAAACSSSRILAFKHKAPAPPEGHEGSVGLRGLYTENGAGAPGGARPRPARAIPQTQERILDAPDLVDDYYLNLLDWSCNNVIAVALGPAVYLWNAGTGTVAQLCSLGSGGSGDNNNNPYPVGTAAAAAAAATPYVCSVAWSPDGAYLAVGTSDARVQVHDAATCRQVRELAGHAHRVAALSWAGHGLASGGRDGAIAVWDVRKRRDEACVARLAGHEQEVCGLAWAPSAGAGAGLPAQLASGGNDNTLCLWDTRRFSSSGAGAGVGVGGDADTALTHKIAAHQAAVKALAWCPFQAGLLASGGGTADRHIRFWNTHTGAQLSSVDTGSQVCALAWCSTGDHREILSGHGFSRNQLCLWKYPRLSKVGELTGHTARVLGMATSPDGTSVVSAGADETLRFWRVWGTPSSGTDGGSGPGGAAGGGAGGGKKLGGGGDGDGAGSMRLRSIR